MKKKKNNNLNTGVYIILLILVSIAYASVAQNLAKNEITTLVQDLPVDPVVDTIEEPVEEYHPSTPKTPKKPTKKDEPTPSDNPTPTPSVSPSPSPSTSPTSDPDPDPDPDPGDDDDDDDDDRPPIIQPPENPSDIDWLIEFDSIKVKRGSVTPIVPATIDSTKLNINFSVLLTTPGQYYEFTAYIMNRGNTDAKIYDAVLSGISAQQKRFLEYYVRYSDGTPIRAGDTLLKGEGKKIRIKVRFKDAELLAADLPRTRQVLNLTYQITYIEM